MDPRLARKAAAHYSLLWLFFFGERRGLNKLRAIVQSLIKLKMDGIFFKKSPYLSSLRIRRRNVIKTSLILNFPPQRGPHSEVEIAQWD